MVEVAVTIYKEYLKNNKPEGSGEPPGSASEPNRGGTGRGRGEISTRGQAETQGRLVGQGQAASRGFGTVRGRGTRGRGLQRVSRGRRGGRGTYDEYLAQAQAMSAGP